MRGNLLLILTILLVITVSCTEKSTEPQKRVTTPTFNPVGGIYDTTQVITINCDTEEATVRYTLNGNNPTINSLLYTEPLTIAENTTIKAIGFKNGWIESEIATANYMIEIVSQDTVATPIFSPEEGEYDEEQMVTISCETDDAIIRYTLNGDVPTQESLLYSEALHITETTTIKAKAFKAGWRSSGIAEAEYLIIITPPGMVAKPIFTPLAGLYTEPQEVVISCRTDGAVIRYTSNGDNPTDNSQVYVSPIIIDTDTVIKARAYKNDLIDSEIATAIYTITGKVATPVIEPEGGVYTEPQMVTITCAAAGAVIRYTTTGDDPTIYSPIYTEPIPVTEETVIRAKAYKNDWEESDVAMSIYVITGTVAVPRFNPPGGIYTSAQNISISCATGMASIRYTTDGEEPTETSTVYTGNILITEDTTLKARAYKEDWIDSEAATTHYIITGRVSTPTFNPPQGIYPEEQLVSISCETEGATIRFTTNGQNPTSESTIYTTAIEITETTTLKARAFKENWIESDVATSIYTITGTIATPTIEPPGGHFNVAQYVIISCETEGVTLRYTTDGSEPTETSERYTAPIVTAFDTTIRAKALAQGWNDSGIVEETYTFDEWQPIEGMAYVQGGRFQPSYNYTVYLSSYYIGRYELTQEEFVAVMGYNPSGFGGNPISPVDNIIWFDAIEYCNRRSMQEGLMPCYTYGDFGTDPDEWPEEWNQFRDNHRFINQNINADGYRLPTEAEWEFAARGGVTAQQRGSFHTIYSGSNSLDNVGWWSGNSGFRTHDVGSKDPNELDMYDMSGNVWEWCWDIYDSYPFGTFNDPQGAAEGGLRVIRGGGWNWGREDCRVGARSQVHPTYEAHYDGFRVVRRLN